MSCLKSDKSTPKNLHVQFSDKVDVITLPESYKSDEVAEEKKSHSQKKAHFKALREGRLRRKGRIPKNRNSGPTPSPDINKQWQSMHFSSDFLTDLEESTKLSNVDDEKPVVSSKLQGNKLCERGDLHPIKIRELESEQQKVNEEKSQKNSKNLPEKEKQKEITKSKDHISIRRSLPKMNPAIPIKKILMMKKSKSPHQDNIVVENNDEILTYQKTAEIAEKTKQQTEHESLSHTPSNGSDTPSSSWQGVDLSIVPAKNSFVEEKGQTIKEIKQDIARLKSELEQQRKEKEHMSLTTDWSSVHPLSTENDNCSKSNEYSEPSYKQNLASYRAIQESEFNHRGRIIKKKNKPHPGKVNECRHIDDDPLAGPELTIYNLELQISQKEKDLEHKKNAAQVDE